MIVKPFAAVRPTASVADQVAALPYDVYDRVEAAAAVDGEPLSFLNIDRPETQFSADVDMYAPEVYAKARELFDARRADGTFVTEPAPCFYLYELTMNERSQTGVVACCAIDDYLENVIKKHENTLEKKELDRIRHIDALDAQTGPIFLTYRDSDAIDILVAAVKKTAPLYDFAGEDGVTHRVWRMAAASEETACSQAYCRFGRGIRQGACAICRWASSSGIGREGWFGAPRGESGLRRNRGIQLLHECALPCVAAFDSCLQPRGTRP